MAAPTLQFLRQQMERMFTELREFREEMNARVGRLESDVSAVKDEFMVHSAILTRLDGRQVERSGLLGMVKHLQNRMAKVEAKVDIA